MLSDHRNDKISRVNKTKRVAVSDINKAPIKVLYTPDSMDNGDILRFDTSSTPHTALKQEGNNWRLSAEHRYAVLKVDFDLHSKYSIEGRELQINNMSDTVRELGTHELLVIVNDYFKQRFMEFSQPSDSPAPQDLNMRNFMIFLENIPTPY